MPKATGLTRRKWQTEDSIASGLDALFALRQMWFMAAGMHQRGYMTDEDLRMYEEDMRRVRRFVDVQLDKERAARGELG